MGEFFAFSCRDTADEQVLCWNKLKIFAFDGSFASAMCIIPSLIGCHLPDCIITGQLPDKAPRGFSENYYLSVQSLK